MEKEISYYEFIVLNNDLIFNFSKILVENKINTLNILDNIIFDWEKSFQMNLKLMNILNNVFSQFSESVHSNNSSKLESSNVLISVWTNIYLQNITNYSVFFDDDFFTKWFSSEQKDIEQNMIDSHNFNILKMFQIGETLHSQLLKILLNPHGDHGQGNLFLRIFLEKIGIKEPAQGTWRVTTEEGKIDLLLKRNDPLSIVVIENKSNWATDQQNQLYRYWYHEIYKKTNEVDESFYEQNQDSFQFIYLAPAGKMYEYQTITQPKGEKEISSKKLPSKIPMKVNILTFNKDIYNWIENWINQLPIQNYRMREYLKQYHEICYNI